MSFPYAPPLPPSIYGGPSTDATIISQSQQAYSNNNATIDTTPSSTSSVSSSLTVLVIIISSAIFITALIYILLQCLSRRRSRRTYSSTAESFVSRNIGNSTTSNSNDRHVASKDGGGLHASLPLFKFGSLAGNLTGGDCAVCLSKFDREDQLRILPLCCHAFHAQCIDAWLLKNKTCPLCRSTVYPTDADVLNKIRSVSDNSTDDRRVGAGNDGTNGGSFRIEIGNISSRRDAPDATGDRRRSYSIGSFEYIVDQNSEVPVDSTHQRAASINKEFVDVTLTETPRESLSVEVVAERSWLKEYMDWLAPFSSSRTTSLRSSGRVFPASVHRNDVVVVPVEDLEANRIGEEISELFQWFSRV